ncbi:MAG: branched-chain amino acid ABC transporter permease [Actinomycetota bacterium]|nr:branched-chain amino acid ABC transporter permease [Actinomycetota bacterium]
MRQSLPGWVTSLAVVAAVFAGLLAYVVVRTDGDWALFLQLSVNGVTLGSVYALIALGYSMVYGILKLLNFAHGDVYMVGAFIGFAVLTMFGGPLDPSVPLWLLVTAMLLAAMIACGGLGVLIERFAYRPLRDAPRIAPLISALGVSFFLQNSALLLLGADFRDYDPFTLFQDAEGFIPSVELGTVSISIMRGIVIAGAVALMIALTLLVARTRIGKAMRATAFDREAAMMMGIDTDRVIAATFFIGSALAGAAGVMFGLVFSQIFHFMGFLAGLKGFTAAVVGGIGSIPGAMLGGLLVGLTEAYATGYASGNWADLIVFSLLVAVMLFRPSGLLGTPAIQKV